MAGFHKDFSAIIAKHSKFLASYAQPIYWGEREEKLGEGEWEGEWGGDSRY